MAKVTKETIIVTPEERFVLSLTRREAEALLKVCLRIGGSAKNSLRGVFSQNNDSIGTALHEAGVTYLDDSVLESNSNSHIDNVIYFKNLED